MLITPLKSATRKAERQKRSAPAKSDLLAAAAFGVTARTSRPAREGAGKKQQQHGEGHGKCRRDGASRASVEQDRARGSEDDRFQKGSGTTISSVSSRFKPSPASRPAL
jgi:hypothetical protein